MVNSTSPHYLSIEIEQFMRHTTYGKNNPEPPLATLFLNAATMYQRRTFGAESITISLTLWIYASPTLDGSGVGVIFIEEWYNWGSGDE